MISTAMTRPSWIRKSEPMFREKPKHTGNYSEAHKTVYSTNRWRKESLAFRTTPPMTCQHPGCIALAEVTDHIIRIEDGGSIWHHANWQKLCSRHHDIKRGKEAHGFTEPSVGTKFGKIPARNKHMLK